MDRNYEITRGFGSLDTMSRTQISMLAKWQDARLIDPKSKSVIKRQLTFDRSLVR